MLSDQIKFPNFKENTDDYSKSVLEWETVFDEVSVLRRDIKWEDWLQDPFHEGLPIFSRVNRHIKTGVVINQILPSDDDIHFRVYMDDFASNEDRIQKLVISTTLTEKHLEMAKFLIQLIIFSGVFYHDVTERLSNARDKKDWMKNIDIGIETNWRFPSAVA